MTIESKENKNNRDIVVDFFAFRDIRTDCTSFQLGPTTLVGVVDHRYIYTGNMQ